MGGGFEIVLGLRSGGGVGQRRICAARAPGRAGGAGGRHPALAARGGASSARWGSCSRPPRHAQEAFELGIINEVVETGTCSVPARRWSLTRYWPAARCPPRDERGGACADLQVRRRRPPLAAWAYPAMKAMLACAGRGGGAGGLRREAHFRPGRDADRALAQARSFVSLVR